MALEARDYYLPQDGQVKKGLESAGIIIEFPRVLSPEEQQEVTQENLTYIEHLSLDQDIETVERAQVDMKKNPTKRLIDLYFNNPNKKTPDLSGLSQPETDRFGKAIFRHEQTRYIP